MRNLLFFALASLTIISCFGLKNETKNPDPSLKFLSQFEIPYGQTYQNTAVGGLSSIDYDPKNDLYECHAPSGPLGIVVDTTPLGPRVRSLNPLSPIFGNICPGDVIVGVDDVDTVGMEAGEFWQIVSRKANQQQPVLTILRI